VAVVEYPDVKANMQLLMCTHSCNQFFLCTWRTLGINSYARDYKVYRSSNFLWNIIYQRNLNLYVTDMCALYLMEFLLWRILTGLVTCTTLRRVRVTTFAVEKQ